jgi:uncharacterized protein
MWQLYDDLIEGIPEDLIIDDYNIGCAWVMVRSGSNVGVALTVKGRALKPEYEGPVIGDRLKCIAKCVKSWNFLEASLGMAAINCFYNSQLKILELVRQVTTDPSSGRDELHTNHDAFSCMANQVVAKKVAVIGRFPHLENQLAPICQLSVLERDPEQGDYPDSACEYILPEQDIVFITGMTLTNKTLPRLLQLSHSSQRVVLVGPSVPFARELYKYGVTDLDGFVVTDPALSDRLVRRGEKMDIFSCGRKVAVVNLSAH